MTDDPSVQNKYLKDNLTSQESSFQYYRLYCVSSSFSGFPPTVSGELHSVVFPFKPGRIDSRPPPSQTSRNIHQDPTMSSGVRLCVLGLLCLHSAVFGKLLDVPPGVLIFCDDPSVEKAVNSSVNKFNERLHTGNKLALFQILTASKSENGSDSVYSLQFTARRSNCPASSNKPWNECDYVPNRRQEPISCNSIVYMTETEADTRQVDCVPDDYVLPKKAHCLGCPMSIDENSEDLRVPLMLSISKYNAMSDSTHLFNLHTVGPSTRQVVAGFRFKLRFDMSKTICAKSEHKDLNDVCVPDDENVEFANCNSTVDIAPWRFEVPQATIECEPGLMSTILTRRRPPGWSPLRNILFDDPSTTSSPTTTTPPSIKASAKEESSEEDTTASKLSPSPDVATEAVNDSPFHCPSKPWKPFNPVQPAAPTKAATEEATGQPTADGAFSDKDLEA
ncbi:kininogen-1 isoform X2 [Cottoperca gobio]|uniref:Kininogen-1 isoform X2 n=1 Tax=Cottoperca gobio TaxID=56716 RepID=A0A6J2PKZ6_COTGO|nr:kininogen-1-like isoform X2 [Cottoperca gobio]